MNNMKLKLVKMIEDNPNLDIVAVVDSDVVADDGYAWWLGSIRNVEIDKICTTNAYNEWTEPRLYRYSDIEELADHIYSNMDNKIHREYEFGRRLSDDELYELAKENAEKHDWRKVIIISIMPGYKNM